MRRTFALAATCALLFVAIHTAAAADDDTTGGTTGDGLFVTGAQAEQSAGEAVSTPSTQNESRGPEILLGNAACDGADQAVGDATVTFCPGPDPEAEIFTLGDIRRAYEELRLPAAKLVIQPPDGLTLVNFDTNFYTTSTRPITRTVTLLGQQVTIEATPAEFHWEFGDGTTVSTTEPGAPYPNLTVTHNYLRTGTYRPSLATTFTGRFRVGGGAWQQIPGTVTIDGSGQALRAIEAQPKLVGY